MEEINNYSMSFDDEEKYERRQLFTAKINSLTGSEIKEIVSSVNWNSNILDLKFIIYDILYSRLMTKQYRIYPAQFVEISSGDDNSDSMNSEIKEALFESILEGKTKFQTSEVDILDTIISLQMLAD